MHNNNNNMCEMILWICQPLHAVF